MTEPTHTRELPGFMNYLVGYACSILLTLAAFGLAYLHIHSASPTLPSNLVIQIVAILSLAQLAVQSIFFLHVSARKEERFNFMAFVFTLYTVAFIVIGSLWIMNNLNKNMTPEQIEKYLRKEN
jgi:cytochrome o ubiquinol oxidase operon protein cyoD